MELYSGLLVLGPIGAIVTDQSGPSIALACSIGALGVLSAAAAGTVTATNVAARIIIGLAGVAAGGLGAVGDALAAVGGTVGLGTPGIVFNPGGGAKLPNYSSPSKTSDELRREFCEQNPTAKNCQDDDCE